MRLLVKKKNYVVNMLIGILVNIVQFSYGFKSSYLFLEKKFAPGNHVYYLRGFKEKIKFNLPTI